MSFPLTLYVLALGAAGLITVAAAPCWRAWCRRRGWTDDPGARKIHDQPIPLAGGLALLTGLLGALVVMGVMLRAGLPDSETSSSLHEELLRRKSQFLAVLGGALGMTLLGWLDDRIEFRPGMKFAGQLLVGGSVAWAGLRITLFVPSPAFNCVVTVLWILTVTNAFNFMDNMNGLCPGLGAIASLLLGTVAALHGQTSVAAAAFLVLGALLGILPFNFPRASLFLGDAGSHLVGFLLAALAILPDFYSARHPHALAVLSPLLILAVPLGDLVSVVWLRWRLGRPFYVGDTNHLSHRLVRRGLSPTTAVMLIWAMGAVLGGLAFLL